MAKKTVLFTKQDLVQAHRVAKTEKRNVNLGQSDLRHVQAESAARRARLGNAQQKFRDSSTLEDLGLSLDDVIWAAHALTGELAERFIQTLICIQEE